jgi:hypothetical protein
VFKALLFFFAYCANSRETCSFRSFVHILSNLTNGVAFYRFQVNLTGKTGIDL